MALTIIPCFPFPPPYPMSLCNVGVSSVCCSAVCVRGFVLLAAAAVARGRGAVLQHHSQQEQRLRGLYHASVCVCERVSERVSE